MTFLGPYDGKQSLYGEILDVFCKKSEHWLPTGVVAAAAVQMETNGDTRRQLERGKGGEG